MLSASGWLAVESEGVDNLLLMSMFPRLRLNRAKASRPRESTICGSHVRYENLPDAPLTTCSALRSSAFTGLNSRSSLLLISSSFLFLCGTALGKGEEASDEDTEESGHLIGVMGKCKVGSVDGCE